MQLQGGSLCACAVEAASICRLCVELVLVAQGSWLSGVCSCYVDRAVGLTVTPSGGRVARIMMCRPYASRAASELLQGCSNRARSAGST